MIMCTDDKVVAVAEEDEVLINFQKFLEVADCRGYYNR